jgi:internalin A
VLRVVSAEIDDCPRLFTLDAERAVGGRRLRFFQRHYRLTLWCEHPGYWHPWVPASYELDPARDWFAQISPYAALIFRTLQLIVPPAGIADVLMSPEQLARAQSDLRLMSTLVTESPGAPGQDPGEAGPGEAGGQLTPVEGHALRAIRTVLFEQDQLRTFGGLRRALAPSGDFLWVCQDHYREYDPGLPTVP